MRKPSFDRSKTFRKSSLKIQKDPLKFLSIWRFCFCLTGLHRVGLGKFWGWNPIQGVFEPLSRAAGLRCSIPKAGKAAFGARARGEREGRRRGDSAHPRGWEQKGAGNPAVERGDAWGAGLLSSSRAAGPPLLLAATNDGPAAPEDAA